MLDERDVAIGPIRPVGTDGSSHSFGSSPDFIRRIVSTGTFPGATQFARIPNGARSTARLRVNWNSAALAESYPVPRQGTMPSTDEIVTMAPPAPLATMCSAAGLEHRNTPS